jgi:hypothetical protein
MMPHRQAVITTQEILAIAGSVQGDLRGVLRLLR